MVSSESDDLFHTPRVIPCPRIYRLLNPGFVVPFDKTGTHWEIGPIQAEKVRTHEEETFGDIDDVSSVCVATQVEGPSPGLKAVMKIKMQSVISYVYPCFLAASSHFVRQHMLDLLHGRRTYQKLDIPQSVKRRAARSTTCRNSPKGGAAARLS